MSNEAKANSINENYIAVIGMAGRFPGAKNLSEFWENLKNGNESVRHFADEELKQAGIQDDLIHNPLYIKARGTLDDVELFDADFFGISPYEAKITDPQHRFFLEVCWEALESAGYASGKYHGLVGVFAGMSDNTYLENCLSRNAEFSKTNHPYQTHLANSNHFLATKVSYFLNLKGPSVNISTACSTSLVTITEACQSLLMNNCDIAIAGGVSIRVPQTKGYLYQEGSIYSLDGYCRAFDKDASGTVPGSGVGAVILKRLHDAIKDGDTIDAVIRGYAINNDGAAKAGYAAPSVIEQSRCIATALQDVDVETVTYVEAHGTGTLLGDPIEIAALTKAFRHYTKKKNYCAIGSVKTNIGHADTAAGIAGFIKTVLALKHKVIPASLHFKQSNPHIQLSDSPFYVNHELTAWKADSSIRRAGVSSFGIGGTNAHIILEEAPSIKRIDTLRAIQIVSLSAKTSTALANQQENLLNYLLSHEIEANDLANIAYTLQVGRKEFQYRKTFLSSDREELIDLLRKEQNKQYLHLPNDAQKKPKVVFLFSGQDALFHGVSQSIYQSEPCFKKYMDQCFSYLPSSVNQSVTDYLLGSYIEKIDIPASILQPSLFILEYSLAKTLFEWGVKPDAMLGYSLGEYVAACLSDVISLSDAIRLICIRGELTDKLKPGAMLEIPLSADKVTDLISNQKVTIAAINTPDSCVISGDRDVIIILQKEFDIHLKPLNLKSTLLKISHAFHSSMVEAILAEYQYQLESIQFYQHKIPYLSNLTGDWITDIDLQDLSYFVEHFQKPIQFTKALSHLSEYDIFLEIGVGQALNILVRSHQFSRQPITISTLPAKEYLDEGIDYSHWLQNVLSKCWLNYIPVIWNNYYQNEGRQMVYLPTYPFERSRFWVDPDPLPKRQLPIEDKVTIYQPYWEVAPLLQSASSGGRKKYIIFVDSDAIASQLTRNLTAYCRDDVIIVTQGSSFKKTGSNIYQINPEDKQDYYALFSELLKLKKLPNHLLHCWSLSKEDSLEPLVLSDRVQINGFFSLVYFAQTFLSSDNRGQLKITVVTNHVKKILIDDYPLPEKATLLGVTLVLPQEYEGVTCQVIDVDLVTLQSESLAKNLISEINAEPGKNNVVAYRRGMRFTQQFKEYKNKSHQNQNYLQKGGVYLITGGLGKIGIKLAEFLASHYAAHLILIARTVQPQPKELLKIREQASSVVIIQADVTDYTQMKDVFDDIKNKHQQLDGVFHLAAIANQSTKVLIKDLDVVQAYRQFMPKVQGAKVIQQLMNEFPVKFCLSYSSIASILGGIGLASYAASNCCLDSIAEMYKNSTASRWGSINWDAWNHLSYKSGTPFQKDDIFSNEKLAPDQALLLSQQCCSYLADNANFIISTTDLESRLEKWINPKNFNLANKRNIFFKDATATVEEKLIEIFKNCLGVSDLKLSDSFYEMGGNSLSAILLLEMIKQSFSTNITVADLINNSSIDKLTLLINQESKVGAYSCLVKLKDSENKQPLFLIHPVGGTVFCYQELAKHLSSDYLFYGIQDPGIELNDMHFEHIEQMAKYYLNQIKKVQTKGPYLIGGYSFGTSVAFEIAKQLEDEGAEIRAVLLIDGWAAFSHDLRDYAIFKNSMERTLNEMNKYIPETIKNKNHFLSLAWSRMQLLFQYRPSSVKSKVILFKAQEILPEYLSVDENTNHWQLYAAHLIKVHYVSGNHSTILYNKGAEQIADKINKLVSQLEGSEKLNV